MGAGRSGALDPRIVRALYDRRSHHYDGVVDALSAWRDRSLRARAVRRLGLARGARVLDVGCGTGLNFGLLRRAGARTIGLDPSAGMLARARRRAGPEGAARLSRGDAAYSPFREGSFDALLATYTLTTVDRWEAALRECRRVLRPGGVLVLTDDRLPPGWFLGLHHMVRALRERGWEDLRSNIRERLRRDWTDVREESLHGGLIYLFFARRMS